jgi:hypothetical protein
LVDEPTRESTNPTLRHVVLFAFKASSTPQQIREIEKAFCELPQKIKEIQDFEWGTDVSVEQISRGYTHCFMVTFLTEKDRNTYLPHPAHQEFGALLTPHLEQVLVIDYWSRGKMNDWVIGIDLGATKIALGLINPQNQVVTRCRIPTNVLEGPRRR